MGTYLFGGIHDLPPADGWVVKADVAGHGIRKQKHILQYGGNGAAQVVEFVVPDVYAVQSYGAFINLIEAAQDIDGRRLPGACGAHKSQGFTRLYRKVDVFQHPFILIICKPDVVEDNFSTDVFRLQGAFRSEENKSEHQTLMRISYAVY